MPSGGGIHAINRASSQGKGRRRPCGAILSYAAPPASAVRARPGPTPGAGPRVAPGVPAAATATTGNVVIHQDGESRDHVVLLSSVGVPVHCKSGWSSRAALRKPAPRSMVGTGSEVGPIWATMVHRLTDHGPSGSAHRIKKPVRIDGNEDRPLACSPVRSNTLPRCPRNRQQASPVSVRSTTLRVDSPGRRGSLRWVLPHRKTAMKGMKHRLSF
jgi:hypothetical protein